MTAIRPARRVDSRAIRTVTERAFGDSGAAVADLVEALAAGPARVSLVAVDERDDVVGHTMLSRGWIDAARELVEALVLSPLSVEPARQRQGIGRTLVSAALAAAESLDAVAVFLEGNPAYYSRLGFVSGSSLGFTRPSVRIPDAAFQVVALPMHQTWMSGALVYPEAFWANDAVGLR